MKVSRGKWRNRLLYTDALITQLMGQNKSTEGNLRKSSSLTRRWKPWVLHFPSPKTILIITIFIKKYHLQLFKSLIKYLLCTVQINNLIFRIKRYRLDCLVKLSNLKLAHCIFCRSIHLFHIKNKNKIGYSSFLWKLLKCF